MARPVTAATETSALNSDDAAAAANANGNGLDAGQQQSARAGVGSGVPLPPPPPPAADDLGLAPGLPALVQDPPGSGASGSLLELLLSDEEPPSADAFPPTDADPAPQPDAEKRLPQVWRRTFLATMSAIVTAFAVRTVDAGSTDASTGAGKKHCV